MWVLGIGPRFSGLAASLFAHWGLLPTHASFSFICIKVANCKMILLALSTSKFIKSLISDVYTFWFVCSFVKTNWVQRRGHYSAWALHLKLTLFSQAHSSSGAGLFLCSYGLKHFSSHSALDPSFCGHLERWDHSRTGHPEDENTSSELIVS